MKSFILREFQKLADRKVIYSIRLLFQMLGCVFICQWIFSGVSSFVLTGELEIIWRTNFMYNIALIMWVIFLVTIVFLGKVPAEDR